MNQKIYDLKWQIIHEYFIDNTDPLESRASHQAWLSKFIKEEFDLPKNTIKNIFKEFNKVFSNEFNTGLCDNVEEYQLPLLKKLVAKAMKL